MALMTEKRIRHLGPFASCGDRVTELSITLGNLPILGVVDYKTLRPAPRSEAEVPAIYLDQLAAYVAAVAAIYPGRRVRAALLWTDGPRLMQVSPAALARRPS